MVLLNHQPVIMSFFFLGWFILQKTPYVRTPCRWRDFFSDRPNGAMEEAIAQRCLDVKRRGWMGFDPSPYVYMEHIMYNYI